MTNEQHEVFCILNEELVRIRSLNPSYSLRAYARRLKMPVSALSAIMNGRSPITRKSAERILKNLYVEPNRIEKILSGLRNRTDKKKFEYIDAQKDSFRAIDMDQFHLIADPFYFTVHSLAGTYDFRSKPQWIAKRLGIRISEAKNALVRLTRLGMLKKNKNGEYRPTGTQFKTSSGIPNVYIRKHHLQSLSMAQSAMEEGAFDSCDFSSMTMAINPEKLAEAKRMIWEFRKQLSEFLESGKKAEVYKVCVQLFPVSRKTK